MSSLNNVQLIGYIGAKPEIRILEGGVSVATFSIATNARWKNKAGEKKERTDWHRIVVYKNLAELADKYLNKGSQIYLEGELRNRSWDKGGEKHYMTEIVGNEIKFLDKKDASDKKIMKAKAKVSKVPPIDEQDIPF
jgi:single-strand DNA-binding protein